jgi:hypothetical protein
VPADESGERVWVAGGGVAAEELGVRWPDIGSDAAELGRSGVGRDVGSPATVRMPY